MQNHKTQIRLNIALIAALVGVAFLITLNVVIHNKVQASETRSSLPPIYNEGSICMVQWKRPNGTWGDWRRVGICYGDMYCGPRVHNATIGGTSAHVRLCKKP